MAPTSSTSYPQRARLALRLAAGLVAAGLLGAAPLGSATAGQHPRPNGPPAYHPSAVRDVPDGAFLASKCRTRGGAIVCRLFRCRYAAPHRHSYHRGHHNRGHHYRGYHRHHVYGFDYVEPTGPAGLATDCVASGHKRVYRRWRVPETGEIFVSDPKAWRRPTRRPDLPIVRRHRNRY